MALTFDEIKTAQTAKGFNLAEAAQKATIGSPTYVPPNPTTPVPVADLSATLTSPAAAASPSPTPFVGSVNDSLKYFQDLYTKQTAQVDQSQKERNDLKTLLGESYGELNKYGDVYRQTESQMGIPQMYEDLNKLNLQLADLSGAYDKEYARVETKGIQSGTPGIFYQGEQAAIQRQKAVEIGALGVRQAAMVGNLDLANQRAEKTVELQFKPIENRINQTMKFLELNYQDMSAAEQRQANTLQNALTFQAQQLQEQKEDRANALMAGVSSKFFKYPGSDQVFDTTTGEKLTYEQYIARGGKPDFSNITQFNPIETQQVLQMMANYGDAGILPSDTLAVATQKMKTRSAKYRKETYIAGPQADPLGDMYKMLQIQKMQQDLGMGELAQVQDIIRQNPGEWGNAASAIDSRFGAGTATRYDALLKDVYANNRPLPVDEKTLGKVQTSPEYKTINALLPAVRAITDYKNAISKYGTFEMMNGQGKGELAGNYGNAISAWKTLAGLGALSGADFALAENAIPSTGLFKRNSVAISQLSSSLDNAVKQAEDLTKRLSKNYPEAAALLENQLDELRGLAYPDKYKLGPDGQWYEIE